ncbi:hypothetical protein D3C72_2498220 [compost metagenome]
MGGNYEEGIIARYRCPGTQRWKRARQEAARHRRQRPRQPVLRSHQPGLPEVEQGKRQLGI